MQKIKWYQKKGVIIPVAVVLGVLGVGASFASLLGKKIDDELNPDYLKHIDEDLFKEKET